MDKDKLRELFYQSKESEVQKLFVDVEDAIKRIKPLLRAKEHEHAHNIITLILRNVADNHSTLIANYIVDLLHLDFRA